MTFSISPKKKKRVKNTEEFCHHGNLLIFILTACSWIYWAVDHFLESVALTMCKLRWNHLLTSHRIFYLKNNQRISALSAWNFKSWYKLSTETRGKAHCVLKFITFFKNNFILITVFSYRIITFFWVIWKLPCI